jgi:FKBP-type peptidyl-prolyl cis-trans isomerase FkpA
MKEIRKIIVYCLFSLTLILLSGCDNAREYQRQENLLIQQFMSTLGDTAYTLEPSGLYYIQVVEGTGRMPVTKDTIYINFDVKYLDGTVFTNTSESGPMIFTVGTGMLVRGVDEGVRYMKPGGTSILVVPSRLAWGRYGIPGFLQGYTPLFWQIQLLAVLPGSKK